jgi:D-alanyl-D-alanine carboxypeptidase
MGKTDRLTKGRDLDRVLEFIDHYLEQRRGEGLGPGIALAITDRKGPLALRAYGCADMGTLRPVRAETLFQIGSISKPIAAAAVFRQLDAGRLRISDPVGRHLEWFQVRSTFEPIQVRHLLSHTSGIVNCPHTMPSSKYAVWNLRRTDAGFPPGAHFHYSNVGYAALGHMLEKITGSDYAEVIRTEVLGPLGMEASEPIITHGIRDRMAIGHWRSHYDDRPPPVDAPWFPTTWYEIDAASGSLACTPGDLASFLRMLLNRGKVDDKPFLSDYSFNLVTQPVIEAKKGQFHGYGLYTSEGEAQGSLVVGYDGEMLGYHSVMSGDMTDGLGVVLFVNGEERGIQEAAFVLKVLRAALHGLELPKIPSPGATIKASDYLGNYRSIGKEFRVAGERGELILDYRGESLRLQHRFGDSFYVPHPDFRLSLLRFGRNKGVVTEAFHAGDWWRNERYEGPASFAHPEHWEALVGHYRTSSPFMNNFRVLVLKDRLWVQWSGMLMEPLTPLSEGNFRVGHAGHSPERLSFDDFMEGKPLRANLSGQDYYRAATP